MSRFHARTLRGGFTLLELLLVVGVVGLLSGAIVFNFSSLTRGADLDEGAARLEGLLKFASAHASISGRRVQLSLFNESETEGGGHSSLRLTCELDPFGQPGQFHELTIAAPQLKAIIDLVRIDSVRVVNPTGGREEAQFPTESGSPEAHERLDFLTEDAASLPINFYPDGSSDSAKISLSSKNVDDTGRITVHLTGFTGAVFQERIAPGTFQMEPDELRLDARREEAEAPLFREN